jgi:hypothetical protein
MTEHAYNKCKWIIVDKLILIIYVLCYFVVMTDKSKCTEVFYFRGEKETQGVGKEIFFY